MPGPCCHRQTPNDGGLVISLAAKLSRHGKPAGCERELSVPARVARREIPSFSPSGILEERRKTGPHPSGLSRPTSAFESDSFEPQQFRLMPGVIFDAVLGSSTLPCAQAAHAFDGVTQSALRCGARCFVELTLPASVVSVPPLGHVALQLVARQARTFRLMKRRHPQITAAQNNESSLKRRTTYSHTTTRPKDARAIDAAKHRARNVFGRGPVRELRRPSAARSANKSANA
jgi:hypothetical protein